MGFVNTLTHGGKWVWITLLGFLGATAASAMLEALSETSALMARCEIAWSEPPASGRSAFA